MKWGNSVTPCMPNMWLLPSCVTGVISLSPAPHVGLSTTAGVVFKTNPQNQQTNQMKKKSQASGVISDIKKKRRKKKEGFKNHVEGPGPAFCLEIFF